MNRNVRFALALAPMLFPQLRFAPVKFLYDRLVSALVEHGYAKQLARSMEAWVDALIPASRTCHIYVGGVVGIRKAQCVIGGPYDGGALVGHNERKLRLAPGVRAVLRLPVFAAGRRVVTRRGSTSVPGHPGWAFLHGGTHPGCVPVAGVCA